jgi:hypothetical protein
VKVIALATALAISLAGPAAWGHSFPPARTVVVQVERCQVELLVGYRPGTGEATEGILARVASQPKSQARDAMRDVLTAYAMMPLVVDVDGVALVPTTVRAKIGLEPGGARPMVVVLVTFSLPAGHRFALHSREPRTTRISWQDRDSDRIALDDAPTQDHWYSDVASFLLKLSGTSGGPVCASSRPISSLAASPVR